MTKRRFINVIYGCLLILLIFTYHGCGSEEDNSTVNDSLSQDISLDGALNERDTFIDYDIRYYDIDDENDLVNYDIHSEDIINFPDVYVEDTTSVDPCRGITCSYHGHCVNNNGTPQCVCDIGYVPDGLNCIKSNDPCGGCSGKGECITHQKGGTTINVCACEKGYTAGDSNGLTCVPTTQICIGGPVDYDVDGDGVNEKYFEPSALECEMYELINLTRATHNDEGTPECHTPLGYSLIWSAHARNHSKKMAERGSLFHEDFPYAQNCAYGCGPECEMDLYMNGPNEGHCPPLSHHCNIMRCETSYAGVGYWDPETGTWNTQNFY